MRNIKFSSTLGRLWVKSPRFQFHLERRELGRGPEEATKEKFGVKRQGAPTPTSLPAPSWAGGAAECLRNIFDVAHKAWKMTCRAGAFGFQRSVSHKGICREPGEEAHFRNHIKGQATLQRALCKRRDLGLRGRRKAFEGQKIKEKIPLPFSVVYIKASAFLDYSVKLPLLYKTINLLTLCLMWR